MVCKDRNRKGGGVAIYYHSFLHVETFVDLSINLPLETCIIKILLYGARTVTVCCLYRPPLSHAAWHDNFHDLLDKILHINGHIFLIGDLTSTFLMIILFLWISKQYLT